MHNASTMAGMAFANAFLGINHSLAHKVGPMFDIPHGRTNAILMPHVIRYNGRNPQNMLCSLKMITSVQTRITQTLLVLWDGVLINNQMLNWLKFGTKVYELGVAVGINMNWKGQGVTKKLLQDTVYTLAEHAYEDQGTTC